MTQHLDQSCPDPLEQQVLSITLDDAPSVAERPDPERMDRMVESLQRLGRGVRRRVQRLLSLWSVGLGLFRQGQLGPLWPHFE